MSVVGSAILSVAGAVANGVRMHPLSTRLYLDDASLELIGAELAKSGHERSDIKVISGAFIGTRADEASDMKMLEYMRFRISFYCSTRAQWNALRPHKLEELGERLRSYSAQDR